MFFQSVSKSYRRYNCIKRLKVADTVIEDKQHIKEYWPSIRTYTLRMKIGGLQKKFKALQVCVWLDIPFQMASL